MSSRSALLAGLSIGGELPVYRVRAHNAAEASENKIHNTEVARQYGFKGGLVPGVTDYAYMTRPLADALGRDWVEHGRMSARFLKPLYDGETISVRTTVTAASADGVAFDVAAYNEAGELCASGSAGLSAEPPGAPDGDDVPSGPLPPHRPEASPQTLAVGTVLGSVEVGFEGTAHAAYLAEIHDALEIYVGPEAMAHPGWIIRQANAVLVANVVLGPWIHVSSDVQHFRGVREGDRLQTRAVVTDVFERKGHEFVDLDVLVVANGDAPVLRAAHRAIYRVRPGG
jgi:acyl dehydratase